MNANKIAVVANLAVVAQFAADRATMKRAKAIAARINRRLGKPLCLVLVVEG